MKEVEARNLLEIFVDKNYVVNRDNIIAEAKRRGLIEQNPLERWESMVTGDEPYDYSDYWKAGSAMRDYLLSELAEAKKRRVGCGKPANSKGWKCGDPNYEGIRLCDDCIKLMREGK